jgi:hypothetical protein
MKNTSYIKIMAQEVGKYAKSGTIEITSVYGHIIMDLKKAYACFVEILKVIFALTTVIGV